MICKISCRVTNWLMKPLWNMVNKITNIANAEQDLSSAIWKKEYDFLTKDVKQILDDFYQAKNGEISYLDLCKMHAILSKGLRKAKKEATDTVFKRYKEIINKA